MSDLKLKPGALNKTYPLSQLKRIKAAIKAEHKPIIGQKRAVRALEFGLGNRAQGFNIFVAGIPGTGKETAIRHFLEEIASADSIPNDWCYVNNFDNSYSPESLSLPSGEGLVFKKDIKRFLWESRVALNREMSSKEYNEQKDAIVKEHYSKQVEIMKPVAEKAEKEQFLIHKTPYEISAFPKVENRPMSEKEFMQLKRTEQQKILDTTEKFKEELYGIAQELEKLQDAFREKEEALKRRVFLSSTRLLLDKLKSKYAEEEDVLLFLEALKNDLLEHLEEFLKFSTNISTHQQTVLLEKEGMMPLRYEINVLVDNSKLEGAPIIYEQNPTYNNLFGKIEKENQAGTLITNYTLIRPGALHKANGGFLLLPIEGLLRNYFSWDSLKRAIKNEEINIEEPGEQLGFLTSKSLKPEPIPLNAQIIIIGRPIYYHLLFHYDEDFKDLFKVIADFDTTMEASDENIRDFMTFIDKRVKEDNIVSLSLRGKARMLRYSHRLANDQERISTRFRSMLDILEEANHYAKRDNRKEIDDELIQKTLDEKRLRSNMWQEKVQEMIHRGELFIDLDGEDIGQVNGISVSTIGDNMFGRPNRITASVSLGRSEIIDIEREVNLGGPIHSKGVMILKGYLADKFGQDKLLNVSAQLVFEQSYSGIEGDSASSAELYA
ncbi:MAG: AAA family ATPase, partial [Bacteroidia bacterium]|nr:AAA family ATPase [Bacteroidia bacterium]